MTEMTELSETRPRRFRPYPAYRDSGIKWLGEIPAHWNVRRLKSMASVRLSNVDKKTVAGQAPVKLCNYVDVYYNEFITAGLEFMNATATPEQVRRFMLRSGDVLITKDSESWNDIAVPAVVIEELTDVVCGYHLAHIKPRSGLDGRFLACQFSAIGTRDQFHLAANGITRFGLGGNEIRNGLFPIAPIEEQRAIADFLDRETAKIDRLVDQKERLVELLGEKRSAYIARAVTRGLAPNVTMKDSGVEWLGRIPAHWKILQGRYLYRALNLLPEEDDGVVTAYRDGQVTLRSNRRAEGYTFAIQEVGYQHVRTGDLVIQGMDAFAGAIGVSDSSGKCSPEYVVLEPLVRHTDNRYYASALRLMAQRGYVLVVCNAVRERAPRFRAPEFRQVFLPQPPETEQQSISDAIDRETARVSALISKVRKAVGHLLEFRSALISAAATGKIDVRDAAS